MATLMACGGGSAGVSGEAAEPVASEEPPTHESMPLAPEETETSSAARSSAGAELTTQEYADALEQISTSQDNEIEYAFEVFFERNLLSLGETERVSGLEANESWADEDAQFASEYAETLLRAATGLYDVALRTATSTVDELSRLRPPQHLSDLHGNFTAALGELTRASQQQMEPRLSEVKKADTDIRNREDLAEFHTLVNSLESVQQDEDLVEQTAAACRELQHHLEAELGRDVKICRF